MKKPIIFSLALLLGAGGWLYSTPYTTVNSMREAAKAHNATRLNTYIDYPAVRTSLKESLNKSLQQALLGQKTDSGMNAFASMLANALVTPMVDKLVTPEGMILLMQADLSQARQEKNTETRPEASTGQANKEQETDLHFHYDGLNRFVMSVASKAKPDAQVHFLFERVGLAQWKLKGIELPES